jgi:hypothetical protein
MDATLRLGGSFRVTNKPLHLPSIVPETPMEENAMAKDRKPAEEEPQGPPERDRGSHTDCSQFVPTTFNQIN